MFNAPYSAECNPIELVFWYWKTRVGKLVDVDIADMIGNIAACFDEITAAEVKKSICHFIYEITPLIYEGKDLEFILVSLVFEKQGKCWWFDP